MVALRGRFAGIPLVERDEWETGENNLHLVDRTIRGFGLADLALQPRSRNKPNSTRFGGSTYQRSDGTVDVLCWCGRAIVRVPLVDVRAGHTKSCSAALCDEAHQLTRTADDPQRARGGGRDQPSPRMIGYCGRCGAEVKDWSGRRGAVVLDPCGCCWWRFSYGTVVRQRPADPTSPWQLLIDRMSFIVPKARLDWLLKEAERLVATDVEDPDADFVLVEYGDHADNLLLSRTARVELLDLARYAESEPLKKAS